MTNSLLLGMPRSAMREYTGSFSFLACWICIRLLMGPSDACDGGTWISREMGLMVWQSAVRPGAGVLSPGTQTSPGTRPPSGAST